MSERRSWDIQRRPTRPVRRASDRVITRARPDANRRRTRTPLAVRRKSAKKRIAIEVAILITVVFGAGVYGFWQPSVRVQTIKASGIHTDVVPGIASLAIDGTYAHILPRNSIFLVPNVAIRAAVLEAFPDVEAVSVHRDGLNSLSVDAFARTAAFAWCGSSLNASNGSCYEVDTDGLIFAPIAPNPAANASSTLTLVPPGMLMVYAPLLAASPSDASFPLRATVSESALIPGALRLVQAIDSLGADVVSLQIRDGEADLFLKSGTRITYLLGHEQDAANLAAAAFPTLNLSDGSIDYVDLRFNGKVYYKNKGS